MSITHPECSPGDEAAEAAPSTALPEGAGVTVPATSDSLIASLPPRLRRVTARRARTREAGCVP